MAVAPESFPHEYVPAPRGGDAVTFLLLHAEGGDESALLHVGPLLDEGAGLLAPRGRLAAGAGARFLRPFAGEVFDLDDLHARTYELADWVRSAVASHRLDRGRVVAVGHGDGATMGACLLLLEPRLLAGAVLFRPLAPLEPERAPHLHGVPVFIAAGRGDECGGAEQPRRLADLLGHAGADVVVHWDNAGFEPDRREYGAARNWLRRRRDLARGLRVHEPPL